MPEPIFTTRDELDTWTRSELTANTLTLDWPVLINLAFKYELDGWLHNTFARVHSGLHIRNARARDALDAEILHTVMRNGWAETGYPGHFQKLYGSTTPFNWNYVPEPAPSVSVARPADLDAFAVYDRVIGFGLQQAAILFNALPMRDTVEHWLELMSGSARAALSLQHYYPDLAVSLVDSDRASLLHAAQAPWQRRPSLLFTDVLNLAGIKNFAGAPPRAQTVAFVGKQSVSYFDGQQIDTLLAGTCKHARWILLELTGLAAPYNLAMDLDLTTPLMRYHNLRVGYEAYRPSNPITGRSEFGLVARQSDGSERRELFRYDWHTWQPCQVIDWTERRGWTARWWNEKRGEWVEAAHVVNEDITDPADRNFILLDTGA